MRYVSVYSKSPWLKRIFVLVPMALIVLPGLFSLAPHLIKRIDPDPPQHEQTTADSLTIIGSGMLAAVIMGFAYRRLISTQVEINEMGIHHLGPGREKMIMWKDLIAARKIHYGKGQTALRLKTADSRYLIRPDLVPDSPDAPTLAARFLKKYWRYPDGHEEPMDVEHGFGWKAVEKYRPELLRKR
jgi:hypothetical protein